MPAFPGGTPLASDLDAVVPDRPVFLPNRDHHGAWVNSRALEIAGIDRETPDPPDGRIERDADGHPTGTLHEGATVAGLPAPAADHRRGLPRGAARRAGLPALAGRHQLAGRDRRVLLRHGRPGVDVPRRGRAAASSGRTSSARCGGTGGTASSRSRTWSGGARRSPAAASGPRRVKIMQDGVAENGTAAMLEPYLDRCGHATDNRGHSFVDAAALRDAVRALDAAGFQVHVHAIGDRGVRETLDAMAGTDPARRHHVAHLQLVHPDDVPRFAELGVAANIQALWAIHDEQMIDLTIPFLGRGARAAGSTRSATCTAPVRGWSPAATGRSRRPTRWPRSTRR